MHKCRDAPNMMSGSDLDGDVYAVTWDPELEPHMPNRAPMNYTAAKPEEVRDCVLGLLWALLVPFLFWLRCQQIQASGCALCYIFYACMCEMSCGDAVATHVLSAHSKS